MNKGAAFYFTIPYKVAKPDEHTSIPVRSPLSLDWSAKRILICEDDYPNYYYLKEILDETGAKIVHVDNGRDAVKIFDKDSSIDLVLMDIKLPEIDGFAATQQIREKNKTLPIIAQTAYAFPADEEKAKEAGCNGFLAKPIDGETLLSVLSEYLG